MDDTPPIKIHKDIRYIPMHTPSQLQHRTQFVTSTPVTYQNTSEISASSD